MTFGLWIIWEKPTLATVIIRSVNSGSATTCSSRSAQTLSHACRCCSVRFLGDILAQVFLIPNSSASTKRTVSLFMFSTSAVIVTINIRQDRASSLTGTVLSPVLVVVRCTAHLQQGFCLQKTFCASDRFFLQTLRHFQRPAEVSHVSWWNSHQV